MVSVVLALASSAAWGVSDFLGGLNSRRIALTTVLLITQVVGLVLTLPLAMLHAAPLLDAQSVGFAVAGSASGLVGIAALYRGMTVGSVSIVAPISATGAAVPVLFGLLRGERVTPIQSLGIVLALIGIVLAAAIQQLTGYFTETDRKPVDDVAKSSLTGPATVILAGVSVGLESAVYSALLIAAALPGGVRFHTEMRQGPS